MYIYLPHLTTTGSTQASFKGSTQAPINGIMHFYDPPKTFQNHLFWLILGSFGLKKTFGGMVGRYMPNSDLGGCPGTRVMAIFVFYVGPHFPKIQYFDVCGGI